MAGTITADKSITLVSRDGYGSIVMNNATMQFKDESNNVRVQIGKDGTDAYSVSILSSADANGKQTVLWNSSGITSGAISDGLIVNNMLGDKTVTGSKVADKTITKENINWSGIAESVDENNVPTFSSGQISVDGTSLTTKWSALQNEVAGITITASAQTFTSPDGGVTYTPDALTLTPLVQVIGKTALTWSYSTDNGTTWNAITNTTESIINCYYNDTTKVLTIPKGFTEFTDEVVSIVFKCSYSESGAEKYSDTMTIMRLGKASSDSVSVVMSNEVQAIATDYQGKPYVTATYPCDVTVYSGTELLTPVGQDVTLAKGKYKVSALCADSGISVDYTTKNGTVYFKTDTTKAILSDGTIDVDITVFGIADVIKKKISYASTKSGVNGEDGLYPHIIYNKSIEVSKEENRVVTCTGVIASAVSDDVDPQGTIYDYTWYKKADNGDYLYIGNGKQITLDINKAFCDDTAIVYFATGDNTAFTETGYALLTEDSEILELE